MNVILIDFHCFKGEIRFAGYFLKYLLHLIPIRNKQLLAVLTHKNHVIEKEKLGMAFCIILHEERALTLSINSNFGIGFKFTLFP